MPRYLQVAVFVGVLTVAASLLYALAVRLEINRWRLGRCLQEADEYPSKLCAVQKNRLGCQISLRTEVPEKQSLCIKQHPVR